MKLYENLLNIITNYFPKYYNLIINKSLRNFNR